MANEKASSTNSSPIKSWMKIAAGSTKSAFKEYMSKQVMPVTAEMAKDLNDSLKKTQRDNKQGKPRKQAEIFKKIMQTPAAKNLQSVLKSGWKEVKRGNVFMIGADGSDDESDMFSDNDDSSGGNTIFGEDSNANAEMANGYNEIGDRLSDQTEATYKAAEVSMNATIMSSSAIIESQEKIGANIISRLDNINESINTIATKQGENMEKFFNAMTKGFDRLGISEKKDEFSQIPDDDGVFKRNAMGKSVGLNLKNYKKRIISNLKETVSNLGNGAVGMVTAFGNMGAENITAAEIGNMLSTFILSSVFENNIGKLGKKIDSVVSDGLPRVIMGLTDVGNSDASGKLAKTIGKILGIDMTPNVDKPSVKFEGKGIPFDDQTKASIVNVIPKHLSEISEYTKLLAQSITKLDGAAMERVRQKAKIFDMNDGRYKSRDDLTKEIFERYYNDIGSQLSNSEFGRSIQDIVSARTSNIKGDDDNSNKARAEIRNSYDNVMKQLAMFMYANGNKGVDLRENAWIEELGKYFESQKYNQSEITQLLDEIKTVASKQSVVNDMASTRLGILEAGKKAAEDLKHNPNLVDTFIVDDKVSEMDMVKAYTELMGYGDRRFQAAGFDRSKSSKTTNTVPRTVVPMYEAYNPAKDKHKRAGRGKKSGKKSAAGDASLGSKNNVRENEYGYSDSDILYEDDYSHEATKVNRIMGSEETMAHNDTQQDKVKSTVRKVGDAGSRYYNRFVAKVDGSGNEIAKAIIHGDSDRLLESVGKLVGNSALAVGGLVGHLVLSPVSKLIFGNRDEKGYREGGLLSGVGNKIHDIVQSVASRIDGKEWTDKDGKVHKPDDPNDSIVAKAKATLTGTVNKFKEIFTGKDEDKKKKPGEKTVVDDIRDSAKDLFSSTKKDVNDLVFGEDYSELDDTEKKARIAKTQEEIKKRTETGLKTGIAGAGISLAMGTAPITSLMSKTTIGGLLGKSVVGTAILNPLVGAGIGFTVGFLSKSDSFQRFLFGGEFTDKNGNKQWREGLIKKSTQEYLKENKAVIGVGAAAGVGTSLLTGAKFGLLGNILGGPLAGAAIGVTSGLTLKSKAFQTFLFGDEEKGILGIKQQWAKLVGNDKNTPSITKEGLKAAGFAATGAAASVKFGTALAKHGLLPSFFGAGGPLGLALLGMVGGMTVAHKDLKKFIFGEDFVNDEGELERKEGILGKFTNALKVTFVQPVANVAKSTIRQINYQIAHNVLAPLRLAFYPFANFGKKLMDKISKGVSSLGHKITAGFDKYFFDPMKLFARAITKPIARIASLAGKAISGGAIAAGNTIAGALGLSSRLAGLAMTPEEREEWKEQRRKAREQKAEDRAKLKEKNRADKRANKDRSTILKYTGGDYADDTAEARRVAERRAGRTILWKNKKPQDGWYTGENSSERNKFDTATPILRRIQDAAVNIYNWLRGHRKSKSKDNDEEPRVGYATGKKKVPQGTDYNANENSEKGTRELINIPRGKGKGSTVVEGRKGSFKVWNGGGETVHNGTEEQPIPILVTGYTGDALDQRDGITATVEVAKITDEAKKTTTEAIDESEAGIKSSIPKRFKDFSIEFGKSFFGPDWEPKKGGLYDIATSVIGDLAGAIFLPIAGIAKSVMAVTKTTLNALRLGVKIMALPFKGAKWLGKEAFNLGKKGVGFVKGKIDKYKNGDGIDLKATLGGIASEIGSSAKETATTVYGNRRYAKYKKLILSGDSFYANRFSYYKDENGKEHIVAKRDVQIAKNIIVHEGQELSDALGAGNLFKRTEGRFRDKIKRRAENANKDKPDENESTDSESESSGDEKTKVSGKSGTITNALQPTNSILEKILNAVNRLFNGNKQEDSPSSDEKQLPAVIRDNPYKKKSKLEVLKDEINEAIDKTPLSAYLKSKDKGSAKVVRSEKEEAQRNALIEVRENENNASLRQLVENSEDEKKTRLSWFGKNGKLIKILGIGAIALFALYKFIGGKGLKSLLTNTIGAIFGSAKQFIGDAFYGLDNLTDQNGLVTNIKEMDVGKVAADSTGGFGLTTRIVASGTNAAIKASEGGIKAGLKAITADAKNGAKSILHWKNPFTQIKTAKNSSMTSVSKAANKALASQLDKASANLSSYAAKVESSGVKTVSEAFTDFVTSIVKKAGGEAAETAAENATKSGVFKELLNALKLKAAKIMAKVSGSKFAKGVAAVVTFGLSEAGFAVIGALNGASGAAKLFHVDKEDVDPLMMAISAAMGAFTSTLVGSIMDAAASIVAEATGMDLLCEVASFVYRLLGDDTKLDSAREKFRQGYEDYKDEELRKQYKTYMAANSNTVGSDYTYEDFVADVESGNKGAKLDSELTYNKKKNKSFLDKVGSFAAGTIKGARNVATTIGTGIFGNSETVYVDNDNEVIYRQQGEQWYAFKWTGKTLVSVGLVDEANIPDSAVAVKCKKTNWFEKLGGRGDTVYSIPKNYGWKAWNGTEINTETGETVKDEDDVTKSGDSDTDEEGANATLTSGGGGGKIGKSSDGETSKDLGKNRFSSDSYHASAMNGFWEGTNVSRYTDENVTLKDMISHANSNIFGNDEHGAAFATINNDEMMYDLFGEKYKDDLNSGMSADEFAKRYGDVYGTHKYDLFNYYDFEGLNDVDDPDVLRESLKGYALFIRDLDTNEYNNGFFLVHPNENSFIRFTMAGNYFNKGYKWTSVLSAWIAGMLSAKAITNYSELIDSLKDEGVDLTVVDPNDIVNSEEDEGTIFDVLGKAFKAMFSSFSTSWRRVMTGEEVDEEMDKTEEVWVDNMVGKKIVRPIDTEGKKPTDSTFKAVSYLFYVLDSSKEHFREYNIFQSYTGVDVPIDVVKNWVKSSEAWVVKNEDITYGEDGLPDIPVLDVSEIQLYTPVQQANGLMTLQKENPDDEYTAAERANMAHDAKDEFEGYDNATGTEGPDPSENILATFIQSKGGADDEESNSNPVLSFLSNTPLMKLINSKTGMSLDDLPDSTANFDKFKDESNPVLDFLSNTPLGKAFNYNTGLSSYEHREAFKENPLQDFLNTIGYGKKDISEYKKTYDMSESDNPIASLLLSNLPLYRNATEYRLNTSTQERWKDIFSDPSKWLMSMIGLGKNYEKIVEDRKNALDREKEAYETRINAKENAGRGGFGLNSRSFSNKQREELDRRFANIKTAATVSNTNARTMSQLVSAEDSITSEMYNSFSSKNRDEEVRKQISTIMSTTQVLMGMDGTYWVWDSVNTFHRYTYFGQDLGEELSNDEMLALYKNGRYLVEERPLSSVGKLQSTLMSNLTQISSNFNTGLSSVGNAISYATSYIGSAVSNIFTTGSSSTVVSNGASSTTSQSSKTTSLWDKIKDGASTIANKIGELGKQTETEDVTKKTKVAKTNKFQQTSKTPKTSKGGFGDRLNGVPYYSQNDSRWKNTDYSGNNDNATMADAGCGPTVLSMVDNYFGGHETPTDYAKLAQDTGYRDETGTNWDFIGSATRAMGLNTSQVENPDALDIADQLSSGQPVILSGTRTMSPSDSPYTKSGHYVVATGLNSNGTVNISDPRGKSYSKAFPIDKLASDTGSMWGFGGKGGFGKLRKELVKRLDKKKKKKGGGRGKYTADEARQIILDWICSLYHTVNYSETGAIANMDGAIRGSGAGLNDCSGLQQWIYRQAMGVEINRDTRSQATNGYPLVDQGNGDAYCLPNFSKLKPGDLIYYIRNEGNFNDPGTWMCHVEMYIGNTHSMGIGSKAEMGSRLRDVKQNIESGSSLNCKIPQKYWGTKRIIQDGQTYDMNLPDPSWMRFDISSYSSVAGPNVSSDTSTATSSSTGSTASISTAKSAKSKDFFEVFSSLMGEVGNRYAKGVATGNFDTDFTAAFDEILNGGTTVVNSGGSSNSSDITGTYNTGGSYPNGGIYNGDYIGAYVKKYESGPNGSRSKGHCGNDWGRSWGSYSFTHHWGNALRFLKQYYPDLAANLRYDPPASDIYSESWTSALSKYISSPDEVEAVWNAALAKDGDQNFFANEHQFAADMFYKPALDNLPKGGTQFNPDTHSRAAQELIWSWAIARGGECVGTKEFPCTGIKDNNISVQDLLAKSYPVRIAKTTTYSTGDRYINTGNPGNSEYTQLLQIADLPPFKMPSKLEETKTPSKKPTLSSDDGTEIKENRVNDDASGKGGFGEGVTKSTLKKQVNALLNRKSKMVHVTNPKTKASNLNKLISIQAKINSFENTEGDEKIGKELTKVSYSNTIPGSNGVKQTDVTTGRGGFGDYIYRKRGGYGNDTNNVFTSEKALNKLVNLVEAIVDYVSQSNNKLDYLKDIKNQQVVVKEGDKNIAVANTGSSYDGDIASSNKSLGRFLAEILASG